MTKRLVVIASVAILLSMASGRAGVGSSQPSGTYDLFVCKGPCTQGTASSVVARGVLVLVPAPFTAKSLNDRGPVHFERAYSIGGDPNGCFVLTVLAENRTFAGLIEFGLTLWRTHDDRVMFELYQSPDAWYFATVTVTNDGFQGSGGSSGGAGSDANLTPDVLDGKRVGAADIGACLRAAAERQRRSRGAV